MVLDCFSCLEDEELTKEERIIGSLCIFYGGKETGNHILSISDLDEKFGNNLPEAVNEMFLFFNCGDNSMDRGSSRHVLVDWDKDSQLICAAVNKVANKEVRTEEYIHWWTFMGYYMGIGESLFSTVLTIRDKMTKGEKLEKYESKFKRDNPQYFVWNSKTVEQREADEWVKQVWNADK